MPLELLFLRLLAPAARRLGELWEGDLCTFTDVTIGLSHLQQVLRELSPVFEEELETRLSDAVRRLAPGGIVTFTRAPGVPLSHAPRSAAHQAMRIARE